MTTTRTIHRAARLLALDQLDQAGLLAGLTAQELGELLDVDPSTAHRTRHDLQPARELARAVLAAARQRLDARPE